MNRKMLQNSSAAKVVQYVLIASFIISQIVPAYVFAEEVPAESSSPEPEVVTVVEPTPEPDPLPEATIIDTGDATAENQTENTVNTQEIDTEGDVGTNESSEPGNEETPEVVVDNNDIDVENQADVDNNSDTNAGTGENSSENNSADTIIVTGDADGTTGVANQVNTTEVDTGDPCVACAGGEEEDGSFENSNSTPALITEDEAESDEESNENPKLVIENNDIDVENDADVDNETETTGDTGTNYVADNTANVYIKTGDVRLMNDILNFVNTTVIGDGRFDVINIYGLPAGMTYLDFSDFTPTITNADDIVEEDVREYYESQNANDSEDESGEVTATTIANEFAPQSDSLELEGEGDEESVLDEESNEPEQSQEEDETTVITNTEVDIDNDAILDNDATSLGNSGRNIVVGVDGNVVIETGNVNISTSITNIANTSIIGNDWRFKIINIYSDFIGDLILPTLYNRDRTQVGCSGCLNKLKVDTDYEALVDNAAASEALSGDNSASNVDGDTTIITGNTSAFTSIFNMIDTTIIDSDWFYSSFNVSGWWDGQVYNTTDNILERFVGSRRELYADDGDGGDEAGDENERTENSSYNLDVDIENDVEVDNDASGSGNSGGNIVDDVTGDVLIKTGDVHVDTSINNILNTTIIGNNWDMYLVNVFGNWDGNVHYGMPDLAVSEIAVPEKLPLGGSDTIEFFFSYVNGGDAPARDVVIKDHFDPEVIEVTNVYNGGILNPAEGTISWNIGDVAPGESGMISYTAHRIDFRGGGRLFNTAIIVDENSDRDGSNNFTGGELVLASFKEREYVPGWEPTPIMFVEKVADTDEAETGSVVNYTIAVENQQKKSGGIAQDVIVTDTLVDADGNEIITQDWNLGTVFVNELILIDYSLNVPKKFEEGEYTNTVSVQFKDSRENPMDEITASHTLMVHKAELLVDEEADLEVEEDEQPQFEQKKVERVVSEVEESDSDTTLLGQFFGNNDSDKPEVLGLTYGAGDFGGGSSGGDSGIGSGGAGSKFDKQHAVESMSDTNGFFIAFIIALVTTILFYIIRRRQTAPLSRDKLKV